MKNTKHDQRQNPRQTANPNPQTVDAEIYSEEELERARTGWSAEDARQEQEVPDNAPHVGDLEADDEDLEEVLDAAGDALTDMGAREMRRDQSYRTGGDDLNPGIDTDMDSNAPKQDDMRQKKRGGSRGQSDWH